MQTGMGVSDSLSMLAMVAMLVALWMHEDSGREQKRGTLAWAQRGGTWHGPAHPRSHFSD